MILIACAVLCNKTEAEEIVDYDICKAEFLEEYFGITKIPSKSTILRILNMVNAELVSLCTVNIMKELFGTGGDIIAIDGKTICSTAKMKSYKEKLHIMTAYMTENGVSLGQLSVGDKTNEIPCMIELTVLPLRVIRSHEGTGSSGKCTILKGHENGHSSPAIRKDYIYIQFNYRIL